MEDQVRRLFDESTVACDGGERSLHTFLSHLLSGAFHACLRERRHVRAFGPVADTFDDESEHGPMHNG